VATVTKSWLFPANNATDYNAFTKNPVTSLTWTNPATVADADTGGTAAGSGYVDGRYAPTVKNSTTGAGLAYLEWAGTWEALGVPAGSVVTSVQVTWRYKCQTYTSAAASTAGPVELRDSAGTTLLATLVAGVAYSATHATWQVGTGGTVAVPSAQQASNSSIRLRFAATQAVGNSTSAVNELLRDYFQITITYQPAAVNTGARVSFPTPSGDPITGGGLQEFKILVRQKPGQTGAGPSATIRLYETNGVSPLATALAATQVSSQSGVVLSGTWDAALLTDPTGAKVECEVVGTGQPGGSLEIGAIEWNGRLGTPTGPASQTLLPDAIISGEIFGSPQLNLIMSGAGAIASAEAFGAPVIRSILTGAGEIASGEAFGAPSLRSTISSAGGIASAEAFGAPSLRQSITANSINSAEAFGSPSLSSVSRVQADPIASGEAFGSPTLRDVNLLLPEQASLETTLTPAQLGFSPYNLDLSLSTDFASHGSKSLRAIAIDKATDSYAHLTLDEAAPDGLQLQIGQQYSWRYSLYVPTATYVHTNGYAACMQYGSSGGFVPWAEMPGPTYTWLTPGWYEFYGTGTPAYTSIGLVIRPAVDLDTTWNTAVPLYYDRFQIVKGAPPAWWKLPWGAYYNDPIQVNPIATAEAFGSPTLNTITRLQANAIPSAEAFGSPSLTLNITGAGNIGTAEAVGSPAVSSVARVQTDPINSAEAFGSPALRLSIAVDPIASAEAFGQPSLRMSVAANPIASGEAFGTPALTSVTAVLANPIGSAEAFGTPALSSVVRLQVDPIASGEAFGTPAVTSITALQVNPIATGEAFGAPTLLQQQLVQVDPIGSAEAFGMPQLNLRITADSIASGEAFGSPAVLQAQSVAVNPIATGEAFGTPAVTSLATVQPDSINSAEAFGQPSLLMVLGSAGGIASAEVFGAPALQLYIIEVGGIASAEAFGIPTVTSSLLETMRPVATSLVMNLTPSTDPAAYQAINDDPDSPLSTWLTGTDPGGAGGTQTLANNYLAAVDAATPAGFGFQLASPANALGTTENTWATQNASATAVGNISGNHFSFASGWANGIPDNATITGVSLEVRQYLNQPTRATVGMALESAPDVLIGAELAPTMQQTAAPLTGQAGTGNTYSAWSVLPTVAQLKSANFRVRARVTRAASQAFSYNLDWIRITVTYTAPSQTTPIEVRAIMGDPTAALLVGAGTGEVRALVRKLGSGSDPLVRVELREGGVLRGTVIANTSVTTTQIVSAFFNQGIIVDPTAVELWILSDGAAGGMVEVGAIEWIAKELGQPAIPTAYPDPIASAEAFGVPALNLRLSNAGNIPSGETFGIPQLPALLSPGPINSAEAFGTPSVAPVLSVQPIPSAEAFGSPQVNLNIQGAGNIASAEAFGVPSLGSTTQVVANPIASAEAFGVPTLSAVYAIQPGSINSGEAFGAPTLNLNIQGAGGIPSGEAFGAPTLLQQQILQVNPIGSGEAFGTPALTSVTAVQANPINSAEAFGTPAITTKVTVAVNPIASAEAFGQPTVGSTITVAANPINSAEAFGTPTLSGAYALQPQPIASAEAFGTPNVIGSQAVQVNGIPSGEAFGQPAVALTVSGGGNIPSAEAFGQPQLKPVIAVDPIPSAEAFGQPNLRVQIVAQPIASAEAFGTAVVQQIWPISPAPIPSGEAFGQPRLDLLIYVAGIPSEESVGTPEVVGGTEPPPNIVYRRPTPTGSGTRKKPVPVGTVTQRAAAAPAGEEQERPLPTGTVTRR
jgi:hypothetical protein